jgi:hypothetical protein
LCIVVSNTYRGVWGFCLGFFPSWSCVLCIQCCLFLWIVHSWLSLRFSLTFIIGKCKSMLSHDCTHGLYYMTTVSYTSARGNKKRSNHKLKLKKDRRHKRQTMIYKTLHTKDWTTGIPIIKLCLNIVMATLITRFFLITKDCSLVIYWTDTMYRQSTFFFTEIFVHGKSRLIQEDASTIWLTLI